MFHCCRAHRSQTHNCTIPARCVVKIEYTRVSVVVVVVVWWEKGKKTKRRGKKREEEGRRNWFTYCVVLGLLSRQRAQHNVLIIRPDKSGYLEPGGSRVTGLVAAEKWRKRRRRRPKKKRRRRRRRGQRKGEGGVSQTSRKTTTSSTITEEREREKRERRDTHHIVPRL